MKYNIWCFIWDTSEFLHISLGRFAPYVFGKMIGSKPHKVIDNKKGLRNENI